MQNDVLNFSLASDPLRVDLDGPQAGDHRSRKTSSASGAA